MSKVTVVGSGNSYQLSGSVAVVNTGTAPVKIAYVTTLFFITGTTFAPVTTNATCLIGASGPITLQPGKALNCRFFFTQPKVVSGKASLPGSIYARVFTPTGQSVNSNTVNIPAPTPLPPTPFYTPSQLTVAITDIVKVSAPSQKPTVSGNVLLTNTGTNPVPVSTNNVTVLYFVTGTTWAPVTVNALCPLGAPNPMPVRAKQPIKCQFSLTAPNKNPGSVYARAWVANSPGVSGGVAQSAPVKVTY